MQIDCAVTESELTGLLPEWSALWQRLSAATTFQWPEWLIAWWRHFGTGAPRVVFARSGGALIGVLPLYLLSEAGCRKLLPLGIGLSDYIDALTDPAFPETADRLFASLPDIPDWDECHLADLPSDAALRGAQCPRDLSESVTDTVPCPVLSLPCRIDALATAVPRKTLRDVHQAQSRSAALGEIAVDRADTDMIDTVMGDLFRLHEMRWRSRGEDGVCADPTVRAFHRDAARALAKSGMLRCYRLRVGARVAAIYYGFARGDRSYAYLGGFDPEMPRLSPGGQLLHHAIAEAITEGIREFHFLRGGESYKYAWGAVDRWSRARTLRRA